MRDRKIIELLSPAKNLACAKAAILAGADTVYMGASAFGARSSAANSLKDLREAASFAHDFGARLYVALNTILSDAELSEAKNLAALAYEAGADALIIQDLGLISDDLPPIEIHASTQCDIRTPEKARFLESAGFDTLVLARELSLSEISAITKSVKARIECFAHGALCVSMSGKCYLSYAVGGRSGNRGMCAQPCRMKYELLDADFRKVAKDSYFLSLKDLNRSQSIGEMLDVGVSAFKIEGRLKDEDYVKNVTAFYRKILDIEIAKRGLKRASFGESKLSFTPDPSKTFNRGFTEYFLHSNKTGNASFNTPKSRGEYIGKVTESRGAKFGYEGKPLHNGDGVLFELKNSDIFGANIQTATCDSAACPPSCPPMPKGAKIWRNKNPQFENLLEQKIERKIPISIRVFESEQSYIFEFIHDESEVSASIKLEISSFEKARDFERAREGILGSLSKLGQTVFEAKKLVFSASSAPFLRSAQINEIRRNCAAKLRENLRAHFEKSRIVATKRPARAENFGGIESDYHANVLNEAAKNFYKNSGIDICEFAPESGEEPLDKIELMRTRHCILSELGLCKMKNPNKLKEPLFLKNESATLRLKFNCGNCGMSVFKAK